MGDLEGMITLLLLLALLASLCIPGGNCRARRAHRDRSRSTQTDKKEVPARQKGAPTMFRIHAATMFVLLAALLLSACQPVVAPVETGALVELAPIAREQIAEVEKLVEQWLSESHAPGMAVAIVKGGEIVYSEGFGEAEIGTHRPLTQKHLFHMASISKTFVSTALMQLVEDGKLDLDGLLIDYIPEFRMADERYQEITIREMLCHMSGIPDVPETDPWWATWEWDKPQYDDAALHDYVLNLDDVTLLHRPGEAYHYSDIAFNILGDVIAQVSGETFEGYVQQHILAPLGMEQTTFLMVEDTELLATPHELDTSGQAVVAPVFPYNRIHAPSSNLLTNC